MDFRARSLGEICTRICSGGTPKSNISEYYNNGSIPWLNTKEVSFNRIRSTEKYITEEGLSNSSAKWISKNSVIVAMYGATAGKSAIAKIPLTTNQACCNLEVNPKVADYRYVYYWLKNHYEEISSLANGGAQQNLNARQIRSFTINLPSLENQKKIALILDSIDTKIGLNDHINDYLAETAVALFNRECSQSNEPNAMLSDIAQITMGQSPSGSSYNEEGDGEVFYQGRAEFGAFFPRRRLFTTKPNRMAQEGDTLMSVRAPVGDLNIANENCCIGRGLAAIHSENNQSFVHYLVRAQRRILNTFNGDGTVFGSINGKALKELPVFLPDNDVIAHLESQLKSIDELIRRNDDEMQALEQMRDTLLPRLMSGEIDVSQIEVPKQLNNHLSVILS